MLSHHWELADLRGGKMQPLKPALSALQFESLDKTYPLTELARGDFNGNGFEDSLVEVRWHYREGTGLGNEILLVQRVQPKPLPPPALVLVCF